MSGRYDVQRTQDLDNAIDKVSKGIVTTPVEAYSVHRGRSYFFAESPGTIAASSYKDYSLQTSSEFYIHVHESLVHGLGANIRMEIRRARSSAPIDISDYGSQEVYLSPSNDVSTRDAASVVKTSTVSYSSANAGELWASVIYYGADVSPHALMSQTLNPAVEKLILNKDSDYIIRFQNMSSSGPASDVIGQVFFCESSIGLID